MVIAALIFSPFLPTAGPISVKSDYNRQGLLWRYPDFQQKKICVSCARQMFFFSLVFTDNWCVGQGHTLGYLNVVSARSMWSCNVMYGVSE
jgi:hypothetical protein